MYLDEEKLQTSSIALARLPHSKDSPDEHPTVAQTIEIQKRLRDQNQMKQSKIILTNGKKNGINVMASVLSSQWPGTSM